jgi:hypothetical protein
VKAALEVLIADDCEDGRNHYKKYFEFHGVGVDTAGYLDKPRPTQALLDEVLRLIPTPAAVRAAL